MSSVNFLEKLLDGTEIKWKALREVAEVRSGWGFPNSYQGQVEGAYPFYKVSDMNTVGNETTMYVANNYIDNAIAKKLGVNPAPEGTIIFPKIGAAIATNKKRLLSRPSAYDNNVMGLIAGEQLNFRFLFHWMKTIDLSSIANDSGALPSIRKSDMENLQIPIPCPDNPKKSLEIQAEIVRILDAMTAHTAELTAELTARKKQYNYYRDKLLSFEDGNWIKLGDIAEFTYGYVAKAQDEGDARFVRITDVNSDGKLISTDVKYVDISADNERFILQKNDLLMARTGATYGKTMIFEEDYPAIYAGFLIKIGINKEILNSKFYWHFAQSNYFWSQANKLVSGGGQPQFNANALKEVKIQIPFANDPRRSLREQARIVDLLDKFDALTASITEGLPREIELRQKQYAYYRDLLLSFPKPPTI